MPRVDINEDNIRHCRCTVCPVQDKSTCAQQKLRMINNTTSQEDFDPTTAPLLYCSIGKSTCTDLDGDQMCLCPTCLVWNDYDLKNNKYCFKGSADEVE